MIQIAWGMVFVGSISMILAYLACLHHKEAPVPVKPAEVAPVEDFEEFDDNWWRKIFDCYD